MAPYLPLCDPISSFYLRRIKSYEFSEKSRHSSRILQLYSIIPYMIGKIMTLNYKKMRNYLYMLLIFPSWKLNIFKEEGACELFAHFGLCLKAKIIIKIITWENWPRLTHHLYCCQKSQFSPILIKKITCLSVTFFYRVCKL